MSAMNNDGSDTRLSDKMIELENKAVIMKTEAENKAIFMKNYAVALSEKAAKVTRIFNVYYYELKNYDLCKEVLHELATNDKDLFAYILEHHIFGLSYDIITESVIKFKHKHGVFNDISIENFIYFVEDSSINKKIIFDEIFIQRSDIFSSYIYCDTSLCYIKFLFKNREYIGVLAFDDKFMYNLRCIVKNSEPMCCGIFGNIELYELSKELYYYLGKIRLEQKEKEN